MAYSQSQSHTATSWARVNHDLQFRSVVAKVEALAEETRRTQSQEAESRQAISYLQARLHALAAAVGELPAVFQGSVREVVAEQERLRADLVLCRQQMREHRTEVTSILEEARRASHAAAEAEHAALRERLGAVESMLEAAVAQQQKLHAEAVEWDQQRRRLEHEEARTAEVRQRVHAVAPRLDGVEGLLHEHAQQLQVLAGGVKAMEHEWTRRRKQADADTAAVARVSAAVEQDRAELREQVAAASKRVDEHTQRTSAVEGIVGQLQALIQQAGAGVSTVDHEVRRLREQCTDQMEQLQVAVARAEESVDAGAQAQVAQELARARDARAVQQKLDAFTHALRVLSERLDVPLPMLGS